MSDSISSDDSLNRRDHPARLRQRIAQLADQGSRVLTGLPESAVDFRRKESAPSPRELLAEVNRALLRTYHWVTRCELPAPSAADWSANVEWFFETLKRFDALLATEEPIHDESWFRDAWFMLDSELGRAAVYLYQIGRTRGAAGSTGSGHKDSL
jgi:hypothetical protein